MPDDIEVRVSIAHLENDLKHMRASIDKLEQANKEMLQQIQSISTTLTEARGGWRVLMWVGGASGAVSSFATWFATHILQRAN